MNLPLTYVHIVKQPNDMYAVYDREANSIRQLDLNVEEAVNEVVLYYEEFPDELREREETRLREWLSESEKTGKWLLSWRDVLEGLLSDPCSAQNDEPTLKLILAKGLTTQDELDQIIVESREDQIPVFERKIVDLCTLRRPVTDLEFSLRIERALARAEIRTVGELVRYSEDELLKIKNMVRQK